MRIGGSRATPAVSVLMPVRNAQSTLSQSIRSILGQDLRDFDFVVVDDGSTDGSSEILSRLAAGDERVRVIESEPQGIVGALNLGLSECRGELIARMDADDVCHPSRLRLQTQMMAANPHLSVCGCLVRFFPRKMLLGGLKRYEEWLNSLVTHEAIQQDMFVESPMPHPGVMLRAGELRELGGYQDHGWPEDYDLWLRYHLAGKRFAKVPEMLLFQRVGTNRLTFSDSRYSVESFLRAKAHYLAKLIPPERQRIVLWGAGMTGRRLAKHLMREGLEIEAVVDIDPKKIGRTMRALPIVAPDYLTGSSNFVVAAVSSLGARHLIRSRLESLGRVDGMDFICAA